MSLIARFGGALVAAMLTATTASAQHLGPVAVREVAGAENVPVLQRLAKLSVRDVPLDKALIRLYQSSGVPVSFSPSLLSPADRVTCECQSSTIAQALDRMLARTRFSYQEIRGQVVVLDTARRSDDALGRMSPFLTRGMLASRPPMQASLVSLSSPAVAERGSRVEGTITGVVTGTDGQPLTGAVVNVVGTPLSDLTDEQGRYTITGVPAGRQTIRAAYPGYNEATQSVTVVDDQTATADIQLSAQAVELEGLVAVGYGTARRRDVTGSIGVVDPEQLESIPHSSPDQALVGQIAGVNVTMPTGLPGSAPQIQVRGVGAVGAGNQPLFVVDGFALPQPDNQAEARLRNPLANIPAEDIESITVLKDASATAIYGSRASNGVVLITTKSGRVGPRQVRISAYAGIQNEIEWMRPKMANARQFATWQNIRYQDMVDRGVISEIPEPYRNPDAYGEGTDWFDLVSRPAYLYNVQASVSGGSQAVRSFFSAGFQQQQGIVPSTDFTRLSLRANLDSQLAPWLEAGLRLAPSYTRRNQPNVGEGRNSATGVPMLACPLASPYDEDGNLAPFIDSSEVCPGVWTFPNPRYVLENTQDERNRLSALASSYLRFDLGHGLIANTTLNAQWVQGERKYFSPSTIGGTNRPPPSVPSGAYSASNFLNWLSETTLNLTTDVGPGRLEGLAGVTFQQQNSYDATFDGDFPDDDIRTLNVASNLVGSSDEQGWSLLSYLGRVNYNLDDRFVFTGTMRLDGSSRFGAQNRWGAFPSGAVAWNFHNERFMSGLSGTIPELRLRVSYGRTGNNQIGNYSSLGVVERDDYLYGGSVAGGREVATLGNPRLGWERTNEWNVGLDLGLFDYRVRATIDAYDRRTTDLLVQRSLPTSSGFETVTDNGGTVRNRGIEIGISSQNVLTEDFSWSTDINWSLNRNKVLALPGSEPIFSGNWGGQPTHMTAVGQPLAMFIGLVQDGIYQSEEEIAAGPEDPGVIPGNVRWKDVNGDGVITAGVPPEGDYAIIGNPHPDFTFGITNSVTLGRFDLRASITGRKGGDVLRFGYYQSAMNVEGVFNVAAEYVENMWTPERPGRMPTPLGSREAIRRFHVQHSGVVASGSNLWLRNVTLRYNLPQVGGLGLADLYMTVENPLILTGFRGNPEAQSNQAAGTLTLGMENFAYPVARQLTLGVDLQF